VISVTLEYCSYEKTSFLSEHFAHNASGVWTHYPGGDMAKEGHRADPVIPQAPSGGLGGINFGLGGIRYQPESFRRED
jgi:hypothetical protein